MNPVEVLILLTMTVVVGNSAYNLLYGTDSFKPSEFKSIVAQSPLSPTDAISAASATNGRSLASAPVSAFASLEVKCQKDNPHAVTPSSEDSDGDASSGSDLTNAPRASAFASGEEIKTFASKVRLNGTLCGAEGATGSQLVKSVVINGANHFNATVFTNSNSPLFTTDYIPLVDGKNSLRIEFSYRDGRSSAQEMSISKQVTAQASTQ